jgi:hypothetical protein
VNVYVASHRLAHGVAFQGEIDFGAFSVHRLQVGDDIADCAGVFVIFSEQLRGVFRVLLPASFCMGAKRGVGGSLRSGFFRFNDRGKLFVQMRDSEVESSDGTLRC